MGAVPCDTRLQSGSLIAEADLFRLSHPCPRDGGLDLVIKACEPAHVTAASGDRFAEEVASDMETQNGRALGRGRFAFGRIAGELRTGT